MAHLGKNIPKETSSFLGQLYICAAHGQLVRVGLAVAGGEAEVRNHGEDLAQGARILLRLGLRII